MSQSNAVKTVERYCSLWTQKDVKGLRQYLADNLHL